MSSSSEQSSGTQPHGQEASDDSHGVTVPRQHSNRSADASSRFWPAWIVLGVLWIVLLNQLRLEWAINENYSYGFVVPVLALYLFFQKWRTMEANLSSQRPAPAIIIGGIASLAFFLLPLRLIQEATHQWRIVGWGMAFVVVGITMGLTLYRTGSQRAKHLAFPIAFIFTAVPWLSVLEGPITQHLMRVDAALAARILNFLGIPALQQGNLIQVGRDLVGVNEACSGIRSLQITLMISLFFGELYRFSALKRIVLILSVVVVALFCNVGRTFTLVWLTTKHGNAVMEKWHDSVGLVVLGVSLAALWSLATWMNRGRGEPLQSPAVLPISALNFRPWPRKFIFLLAGWILFVEAGTELWYRAHEMISVRTPMWTVQWPEGRPGFKTFSIDKQVSRIMQYSEGECASWPGVKETSWSAYFFRWAPGPRSAALARAHNPEVCMPSTGHRLIVKNESIVLNINGLSIPFVHYLFEDSGRPLHVWWCVWNEASATQRRLDPRFDGKAYSGVLKDVLRGQRNLGQQVLEIALSGEADPEAANEALRGLLSQIITSSSWGSVKR